MSAGSIELVQSTMDLPRLNLHLPIITPHIEFSSSSQSHPPTTITPRVNFAELWIMETKMETLTDSPAGLHDSDDSAAMDLDLLESESSDDEVNNYCDRKIPKPPGEPGQPNSGGYNIENELRAWGADKISHITVGLNLNLKELIYNRWMMPEICEIEGWWISGHHTEL